MKKQGKIQKLTSLFLVFVMLLGVFIPTQSVLAESKEVDVTITDFNITNSEGVVPPNGYFSNTLFKLNYKWDASNHENELHEGDYFELDLPDQFKFPSESSYCNFDINAPTGEVMAKAVIVPQDPGGGKIKVTFTNYVNDKFNITGDMHLTARWNTTTYPVEQEGEYEVAVGSFNPHITLKPYVPPQYGNEILYKVSGQTLTNNDLVRWRIRINAKQGNLNNVVIKDTLEVEDPGSPEGIEYVAGEFVLYEIVFEDDKPVEKNPVNVSNQVALSSDKRSFTYSMGNLDGKAYMLHYRSTYRQGFKLKNTAELTSTQTGKIVQSQFQDAQSGGGGQGDLTSKIKIVKVAEDNEAIKLKDAKFTITRKETGASFDVITDSNGEAVSMQLIPGEYTIKEIASPTHYLSNNAEYTVTVTSDQVTLKTIKNEPEKIDIKVKKTWIGGAGNSITAVLKANGEEVARHELSAPTWTYTFTGLRKYEAGTNNEITYTVEEANLPQGYSKDITGNITDGFTIINTNIETVDIPVEKKWVGAVGESVKVQLKAEGSNTVIQEHELKASEDWKHTFTGLKKYAADGSLIKYKVEEVNVPAGYTVQYETDPTGVLIIKNIQDKIEVKVKKSWVEDVISQHPTIKLQLLKNGQAEGAPIELTNGTTTHTWSGLDKTDTQGNDYKYTVKEVGETGGYVKLEDNWYKVTYGGSVQNGLTVTNKKLTPWTPMEPPTRDIKVTKDWKDVSGNNLEAPVEKIEVELYKDGTATGQKLELTKDNNWSGVFKNLEVADGLGSTDYYNYTVKEIGENTGAIKLDGKWFKVSYSGTMKDGFTITNQKEKPWTPMEPPIREVKVTKLWKEHSGNTITAPTDKITVELYKDGNPTGKTLELNASNNWSVVFKNLEVANGLGSTDYYKYTVKEVGEDGNAIKFDGKQYKVVYGGSMQDGLTITNEKEAPPTPPIPPNTEKPKVPNTNTNKTLPKTGDGTNLSLYAWLLLTSGSLLVLLGIKRRNYAK